MTEQEKVIKLYFEAINGDNKSEELFIKKLNLLIYTIATQCNNYEIPGNDLLEAGREGAKDFLKTKYHEKKFYFSFLISSIRAKINELINKNYDPGKLWFYTMLPEEE